MIFCRLCKTKHINTHAQKKQTPLHLAAEAGQLEVCDTLLQLGADTNATNDAGQKAVHVAAMRNNSEVVKLFLKSSPELVTTADKVKPALEGRCKQIIFLLLRFYLRLHNTTMFLFYLKISKSRMTYT